MSHYDTLEVSRKASAETIRAAYKSLMQRYHPDRNLGDAEAAARAVSIQQAYEVLSDTNKRAVYDLGLEKMPIHDSQSAAHPSSRLSPEPETAMFTPAVIGVAVILTLGVIAGYLMRDTPQPVQAGMPLSSESDVPQIPGRMIDLIDEVEVIPLLKDDGFRTFTGHTLAIPRLKIFLGNEELVRSREFILIHRDDLRQRLRDALSQIPYETLLIDTGEEYIKARTKEVLNEHIRIISAISPLPGVTPTPLLGNVEKVTLPDSFDVK